MFKRIKIVATLGPATETRGGLTFDQEGYWDQPLDFEPSAQKIAELIRNGANVFRFNFSHGDHEEHAQRMKIVHRAEEIAGQKVGFMLDTKGPEIRTMPFEGEKQSYDYRTGDKLRVATKQGLKSTKDVIALNVAGNLDIYDDVAIGKTVLVDDGKLGLTVYDKDPKTREFLVEAQNDEAIARQKGVNIPDTTIPFRALADSDADDIRFGLSQPGGINFIAISFVRTAKDVNEVREICKAEGHPEVKLFAKIENTEGIGNIDSILEAGDGIMVARGDMGIEVPFEMVPVYQKLIITHCDEAGKVAITATNMLETMTTKPRATRSEISDVFNAVLDGTDATMLSGESANGIYPAEAVKTMATVDVLGQQNLVKYGRFQFHTYPKNNVTEVVASAVRDATKSLDIKLIVALTESGNTARLISKYRPNADILAVAFDEKTERSLTINWGVIPVLRDKPASTDDMFEVAEKEALKSGLVQSGDNIVVVAGVPVGSGRTNTMRIRTIK